MKTAISVPDDTFAEAERRARTLGMSRSEFFTVAARRYMDEFDTQSLTNRIDAVIDLVGDDESGRAAVNEGRRGLADYSDEW